FGIAEQVQPSVNALIYQPGDIATLARHMVTLAEDEALRRSLAERSPHVLRSLPDDRRMTERYRRTILPAAESSPPSPAAQAGTAEGPRVSNHRRSWFVDSGRQRRGSSSKPRAGATTATLSS